jgi:murein DD-endopeptidase MepM/ murein hydrolase activator NlpD
MKYKILPRAVLMTLLASFFFVGAVPALTAPSLPPPETFQLPWEQGLAWVSLDGFDNGTKRLPNSPHNYMNGGAIDFAPRVNMRVGEDTSNFWVTAVAAGTVVEISKCHLKINHGNGWISEYQFLANIQVKLGEAVHRNQRLAVIADGLGQPFCPPALEPDVPHLHFSLRPTMHGVSFAGWMVGYIPYLNKTTFTKNNRVLTSYQPLLNVLDLQIVLREPITWDTVYIGSVDAYRYERWPFVLNGNTKFTLTATPTSGGLSALLLLLDANGNEIARGAGSIITTLPAGNYFVQVQPQTGSGFYNLLLTRNALPPPGEPSSSADVSSPNVETGKSVTVSVSLNNIPAEGYTSAEFTCVYDPAIIEVSAIAVTDLFGPDPAVAIQGPQGGKLIVAVAGSRGNKAVSSGVVFTFSAKGLQAGQTAIECRARVSKGDGLLFDLPSTSAHLTVLDVAPTPTPQPTHTLPPSTAPILTGKVLAYKPVTVDLFASNTAPLVTVTTLPDGSFSLTAPAGTYRVVASLEGYLSAETTALLAAGTTVTLPPIALPAGDIDGNNVIDQFDAMTIGMNYNTAHPSTADLNGDGMINVLDLEALAGNYRRTGPLLWR